MDRTETSIQRNTYSIGMFDLVKGLGIIQIILFHSADFEKLSILTRYFLSASSFALMGMFYVISGMGVRGNSRDKFVKQNIKKLIRPYIYVMLCAAMLFPFVHFIFFHDWHQAKYESLKVFLAYVLGIFYGGKNVGGISIYSIQGVWYLLAIFWASILLNEIIKLKKTWIRVVLVGLICVLGISLEVRQWDYYCFCRGCMALPAVYLGYYIKKKAMTFENCAEWKVVLLWIVGLGVPLTFWWIYDGQFSLFLHTLTKKISECCFGLLCVYFSIVSIHWNGMIFNWIRQLGKYSLWIICIHALETNCIPLHYLSKFFSNSPNLCWLVSAGLRAIIIYLGIVFLLFFNKRVKQFKRIRRNQKWQY